MKTYQLKDPDARACSSRGNAPPPEGKRPDHAPDLPQPVGIDLHPDIFDAIELKQGKRSKDARVMRSFRECSVAGIKQWALANLDPDKNLLVIEATSNTFDCVFKLTDAGFSCVVVESAQMSKVADSFIDNDLMAAERIARGYLTGFAKVVWVPDAKTKERREILHAYDRAVTSHVRATNELKGFLTARNIRPGKRNLHLEKSREWIATQLGEQSENQSIILDSLYINLDATKKNRDTFYQVICREVLAEPKMLNNMRIIGIGVINAFAILAIVGDITRFANAKKLVSYFGLNPGRKKSGNGKDIKVPTGNRGRRDMRSLLIQAAQSVLKRARADKYKLAKWGFKIFARTGKRNIAVVAIARKLTHSLYYLLSGRTADLLEQREPMRRKFHKLSAELGAKGREALGLPVKRSDFVAYLFEKIGWPEQKAVN